MNPEANLPPERIAAVNQSILFTAESNAAVCREFLTLTADPAMSNRRAAQILGKSPSFFSGQDSYLARYQRDGFEGLLPTARETPARGILDLPPWFIPAAKFIYLWSNYRRCGGSVTESVLRVVSFPVLKFGSSDGHRQMLLKHLKQLGVWSGDEIPECPAILRETILKRFNSGQAIVPRSIARQILVPAAIVQKYRSPRAFALDNLSAPGSQRRYYNAATGQREIMLPGDWVGADDATPGIAVCVPCNEVITPCSQNFGVLLGRFQLLAFIDCRTDRILAFDYVVRPRGSYRGEDILNGMGTVIRTHGIPRRGFQFEGGTFNCRLVRQAIQLLKCDHWRTYSPHCKSVEAIFNKVWSQLAIRFPDADLGRYRNEKEANCKIYEACRAGRRDPRKCFPSLALVIQIFEQEIAAHNARKIFSSQYGQWVPDELFEKAVAENPLRKFTPAMEWIFSPFTVERKVSGMTVACRVPMFENFSVPFHFAAPWLPLHRGKRVRLHFDPRLPKCTAKIVLLEDSGTARAGAVLGDAQLVGETAQYIRHILNWAQDDRSAGYVARQRVNHFMSRSTRAIGPGGRVVYSTNERRDGLGTVTRVEKSDLPSNDSPPPMLSPTQTFNTAIMDDLSAVRRGKIGRLPLAIRQDVNQRLLDGQTGPAILLWLNALEEVKQILKDQFEGLPIGTVNLSVWRKTGFKTWIAPQNSISNSLSRLRPPAEKTPQI